MRRQCLTTVDAVPAKGQHKKPCSDCPFARHSLPGWLGGATVDEWLYDAHGEGTIPCHVLEGAQCAGAAVYRRNVLKRPRDPAVLVLPADRETVFATPVEFADHHNRTGVRTGASPTGATPPHGDDEMATSNGTSKIGELKQKHTAALAKLKEAGDKKVAAATAKGEKAAAKVKGVADRAHKIVKAIHAATANPDTMTQKQLVAAVGKIGKLAAQASNVLDRAAV